MRKVMKTRWLRPLGGLFLATLLTGALSCVSNPTPHPGQAGASTIEDPVAGGFGADDAVNRAGTPEPMAEDGGADAAATPDGGSDAGALDVSASDTPEPDAATADDPQSD